MATQKGDCTMYTVSKLWPHKRVIVQCTRCQSYGHTNGWLQNVQGAKAMVPWKYDCTMYTVPQLWPHKRVIAQWTRCQSYGHTKGWLHNVHGAKAMAIQKGDCTMYTVPKLMGDCTMYTVSKLWPHKRVIAQCTRCQSYGHTILKVAKNLKTLHPQASYATGVTLQTPKAAWSTMT
jgi:hypothetical protein